MKVSALYVYPIKGLRGIGLESAEIGPQGIRHDRRFMLYEVQATTSALKKIQLDTHPACALFQPQIVSGSQNGDSEIVVRFLGDPPQNGRPEDENGDSMSVPLEPNLSTLDKIEVDLHGSPASAYRMGDSYDVWFSRRFGVQTILVYLGDGRRAVLGNTLLPKAALGQQRGWITPLSSYISGTRQGGEDSTPWIAFSDVAPLLVASESSLQDVRDRLLGGHLVEMYKFRPNIVVDGQSEDAWAEDFWAELRIGAENTLQLTGNCVRCVSLNVDYKTGKPAEGEEGNVLKRLMKDRRVDTGSKWSPVFGRYAFLGGRHSKGITVAVGDGVEVTRRNAERTVWDWPDL
ncbi:MOSC domain-containing protein [Staphylotrichum tortipilum]|uniref:MOSC domain-containing protein n=1 Tax=Staphylotrichum tortipilum TaxID=2831512 RepID=A0AAN6RVZ6_9PEZI|nr:MOSC domain-containing protein [Staphylotrichum longicolle]